MRRHRCSRLRPAFASSAPSSSLRGAPRNAAGGSSTGAGGTGSSFAAGDFFIGVQHEEGRTSRDFEVARFFNKANCDCNTPVYPLLRAQPERPRQAVDARRTQGNVEVWIGARCNDINLRGTRCTTTGQHADDRVPPRPGGPPLHPTDVRMMSTSSTNLGVDTTFDGGVTPAAAFPNPDCTINGQQFTQTVWVLVDSNNDGVPDVAATQLGPTSISRRRRRPIPRRHVEGGEPGAGHQLARRRHRPLSPTCSATRSSATAAAICRCSRTGPSTPASRAASPRRGRRTIDPTFDGGVQCLNPLFVCSPLLSASTSLVPGQDPAERHHLRRGGGLDRQQRQRQHALTSSTACRSRPRASTTSTGTTMTPTHPGQRHRRLLRGRAGIGGRRARRALRRAHRVGSRWALIALARRGRR